jgi:TolB-like protein/tetratricopeptide (TPR) repeat protein
MITPSHSYDIFVSYRHNDNKAPGGAGDGWVTEFVNHLTNELETMVKGGVSVYFDKNPHTGLRETDQVEASLQPRLQSLIFIPVLSQTYCDPASYAWNKELLPFLHQSEIDPLGPSVKLQNGNVASRILPVNIHELDPDDLQLVESTLQGKLRAIPFVFKSPGVNRPLRSREVDPMKNLNRTVYGDQINKLANAIKEIIHAVRSREKSDKETAKPALPKKTVLDVSLPATPSIRSIAVLPLVFHSQNQEEEFLSQGFAEDLFSALKQIKALRTTIHGLTAPLNGKTAPAPSPTNLPATLVLTGTMTVQDNSIGVTVRLVQARDEAVVWEKDFTCGRDELFSLRPRVIENLCSSLGITLKDSEKKLVHEQAHTGSAALQLYWKGRYHWRKRGNDLITSLHCFEKAADLDPQFALAYAGIANAAVLLGYYEMIPFDEAIAKCRDAAMAALNIDPTVIEAYYALAYVALCYEWSWPDAGHNFAKVFEINPNSPVASRRFRTCLTQILCTFEEAESESPGTIPYFLQAYALLHKGKFEEGLQVAQIAIKKDPSSFMAQRAAGLCYLGLGYEKEAIETLNTAAQLSNRHPLVLFDLIGAYATLAHNQGAQEIMEEAMANVNSLPARINDYYFQPA